MTDKTTHHEPGVRLISLQATNFKGLRALEIKDIPDSGVLHISGKNGAGKSSVLDAIWAALGGKRGTVEGAIKNGAESAEIKVGLNDEMDLGEMLVRRTITADGTKLQIIGAHGTRFNSPQSVLDKFWGDFSFDPMEFVKLKPKEQRLRLLSMVETDLDVDAIEERRAKVYEARTVTNRKGNELKAQIEGYNDLPETRPDGINVASVLEERKVREAQADAVRECDAAVQSHAINAQNAEQRLTDAMQSIELLREQLQEAEDEAQRRQTALDEASQALCDAETTRATLPDVTFEDIDERLAMAEEVNTIIRRFDERDCLKSECEDMAVLSIRQKRELIEIEAEKVAAVEAIVSQIPVPGIGFDEGCVTYNNVPLSAVATSERNRVCVQLAMAANPMLRIIRISDGSLLDDDSLRIIDELARGQQYLALTETVDSSVECGVIIEDATARAKRHAEAKAAA